MNNTYESSLTAPEDRDLNNKWRPQQSVAGLSQSQTQVAMEEMNITSFTDKFPKVDRTYADPPVNLQQYGLISWIPAKGATPNENGIYGFAKMRGNYATDIEANQRAEYLIKEVDSYNKIYHAYVGRPFPLTSSSDYSAETEVIDIKKDMTQSVSNNVKQQKKDEYKEIEEIKSREQALVEERKAARADEEEDVDPYENYITLKVKKAQLTWTYLEHIKKMEEIKDIIINTRNEINELDSNHSEFKHNYYDKYMKAREEAGLKESKQDADSNFMKFMVEEAELPGIDIDFEMKIKSA